MQIKNTLIIKSFFLAGFLLFSSMTTALANNSDTAKTGAQNQKTTPDQMALLNSSGTPAKNMTPEGALIAGTLAGVAAGTTAGALTGNLWLIPAGSAAGALAGLGLAVFVSDEYAFPSFCDDNGTCEPIGFLLN